MIRHAMKVALVASSFVASAAAVAAGCSSGDGASSSAAVSSTSTSASSTSTSASSASTTSSSTGSARGSTGQGGASTGSGESATPFTITFEGRVGAEVFSCASTYKGLGVAATDVKIADYRLYIHEVRLHEKGGGDVPLTLDQDGVWQVQDLALLDFEDKSGSCSNGTVETNKKIVGKAPARDYDGISFRLGVPFALNHADASVAPSPLNLSGLFWSWNAGYKYMRVDTIPEGGSGPFLFHLGSTDCEGDFADGGVKICARPNIADVVLTGFDPAKNKVVVDYGAIVANSDLSKDMGGAPGCMSGATDPECAPIFKLVGIDITDGTVHPEQQKLFHVE